MAQLQDTTFRYTDSNVTSFVVKPYTANGPSAPSSSVLYTNPDGVSAVSANTSLVLVGRGTPFYGEIVQRNLVYLLENFASPTRPQFPTIGQLWYKKSDYIDTSYTNDPTVQGLYLWTGTSWNPIVMQTTNSSGQLDLSGNRIVNVGTAVNATDGLNMATGDSRYLRRVGGFMTGDFSLDAGARLIATTGSKITIADPPVENIDVVNLGYMNTTVQALTSSIATTNARIDAQNTVIDGVTNQQTGTYTTNLTITNTATLVVQSGGSAVQFGGRQLSYIAMTPVNDDDAASKHYVDTTVSGLQSSINTVSTNLSTFETTIQTNSDAAYVAKTGSSMTGSLALASSADLALSSGGNAFFGFRRLQNVGVPTNPADGATKGYVDTTISTTISKSTWLGFFVNPGATITLPPIINYVAGTGKVSVYLNGVRLLSSYRAMDAYRFKNPAGISSLSDTGLPPNTTLTWQININFSPVTLSITTGPGITPFYALVNLLNTAATAASYPILFTTQVISTQEIAIVGTHTLYNGQGIEFMSNGLFNAPSGHIASLVDPTAVGYVSSKVPYIQGQFEERGSPGSYQSVIAIISPQNETYEVVVQA